MDFKFTFKYNESAETDEFETANYQWNYGNTVILKGAWDFDDAVRQFLKRYERDLNEIYDCEAYYESDDGYVTYGNTEDGMSIRFDIERIK